MADVFVHPGRLTGRVVPPPSKSDAHRALFASFLSGQDRLSGLGQPLSDDVLATQRCLKALASQETIFDCGESGTTLRLLVPVVAAWPGREPALEATFTGRGRLIQRPLKAYQAILGPHGARLCFPDNGALPLRLTGRLRPGLYQVPGHISSQYLSGLLLALPLLPGPSDIQLTSALQSAPYVHMTLQTMARFGVQVIEKEDGYRVPAPQAYQPTAYQVERDFSQAAFWLTAAYGGCPLQVAGLPETTRQGDRVMVDILADLARKEATYTFDLAQTPDLVPVLAVAAALTPATVHLTCLARLRYKESDRIKAVQQTLSAIGIDIESSGDSLLIRGGHLSRKDPIWPGGTIDSFQDHRIVMAAAIAALFSRKGVRIQHADVVSKSYPDFFLTFKRLGGAIDEFMLG